MTISFNFITGFMLGFEIVDEDDDTYFVLDLFIIRILICN